MLCTSHHWGQQYVGRTLEADWRAGTAVVASKAQSLQSRACATEKHVPGCVAAQQARGGPAMSTGLTLKSVRIFEGPTTSTPQQYRSGVKVSPARVA